MIVFLYHLLMLSFLWCCSLLIFRADIQYISSSQSCCKRFANTVITADILLLTSCNKALWPIKMGKHITELCIRFSQRGSLGGGGNWPRLLNGEAFITSANPAFQIQSGLNWCVHFVWSLWIGWGQGKILKTSIACRVNFAKCYGGNLYRSIKKIHTDSNCVCTRFYKAK